MRWNITVLFNQHVGPIMIICQIKKGYISISRTCEAAQRRKRHLVESGCSVQCVWEQRDFQWSSCGGGATACEERTV